MNTDNTNLILKIVLPGVILLALVFIVAGFILSQKKTPEVTKTATEQWAETTGAEVPTAITTPVSLPPLVATSASESALIARINELSKQVAILQGFETKNDNLEKQIDDLSLRIAKLENQQPYSVTSPSPVASSTTTSSSIKGSHYIYALGYGGSVNTTDWTEVPTLIITFDPSLYPGYKSLQFETYMHVRDGNGKAFARLYSSGTPAGASEVTSTNYQDEWVSGGTFTWNSKSTFTVQLKSLTGYDAYISNARIKINF